MSDGLLGSLRTKYLLQALSENKLFSAFTFTRLSKAIPEQITLSKEEMRYRNTSAQKNIYTSYSTPHMIVITTKRETSLYKIITIHIQRNISNVNIEHEKHLRNNKFGQYF